MFFFECKQFLRYCRFYGGGAVTLKDLVRLSISKREGLNLSLKIIFCLMIAFFYLIIVNNLVPEQNFFLLDKMELDIGLKLQEQTV